MKTTVPAVVLILLGSMVFPAHVWAEDAASPSGPSRIPQQTTAVAVQGVWLTLDDLIAEVERANPELRVAAHELRAMRERVRPAGAFPDPKVNFGQMNVGNIVPFTTLGEEGFSEVYVGITQEFPFYGKRGLREKVAQKEADAEFWVYELTRLRVLSDLKVAYYELFYWHQALETLQKDMRLLEQYSQIASALYKVGKGNQADVLRAQTELSRLQDRIEVAEQHKEIAQAQINAVLNRPAESPLGRPAPVVKAPLPYAFEDLLQLALDKFPLLRRQAEMIESREYALRLAEKEKYPDFGLVFAYHNRGALRDYWTIGGTARIPLYFGRKQKHEIQEADARLSSAREREESVRALLQFQVKDQYLAATTSDRLLHLFERTIIPQETLTLEATSASYEVGAIDFLSVIDSLTKLLDDELRYYEHLTNYQKALARLEPLVGVELTH
ncbi:MAG: TolC family protein [Acidobacteriota bacterium]